MLVYISSGVLVATLIYNVAYFSFICYHKGICEYLLVDRWIFTIIFSSTVALWGLRKKSLDWTGALGGMLVGLVLAFSSYCFLAGLLVFFFTSSKATKFRAEKKRKFEPNYKEGGQRNWVQVICNGGAATELALLYILYGGVGETALDFKGDFMRSWLSTGVIAALAGVNGDTWASEIGTVVARGEPRLITTFQKVPTGTNGGVSITGLAVSALGGAVVGLAYCTILILLVDISDQLLHQTCLLLFVGTFAGLFGSLMDSLIGATLQYSGIDSRTGKIVEKPGPGVRHISGRDILDNHSVNLIMSVVNSVVVPSMIAKLGLLFS